ncbi:hypothetical protein PGT21_019171 [Puccinia graminis f. sp. tritici]|uniref:Uncharacterized protein n=1 Tax=Puccinia graminis f. sp. tritici TaxID=56615 RepID=A0A5B0NUV7_PUCGR|nr:hypothetical protein PGT21_019171 [Puccinia graminis f. sp. tritici]KAA1115713.1 hypothetical protein PGTUg99_027861 [Puccinia graminis f. sp. tritici]
MTIEDKIGSPFEGDFAYHQTPQTQAEITRNELSNQLFEEFMLWYQAIRDHKSHTYPQFLALHLLRA